MKNKFIKLQFSNQSKKANGKDGKYKYTNSKESEMIKRKT